MCRQLPWIQILLSISREVRGERPQVQEKPVYDEALTEKILEKISEARRPVMIVGEGIRFAGVKDKIFSRPPICSRSEWLKWCKDIDAKYPACLPSYEKVNNPINPYVFIDRFSKVLADDDAVICGNGSACVITFQAMHIKDETRLFTNSGCAAMGYGFPAALGCAVARGDKRTICIDGDGSFQMNIQEMQTVIYNKLNLKTFIINNNGYHSIRQTQTAKFNPPLVGVCDGNGLSFPDL